MISSNPAGSFLIGLYFVINDYIDCYQKLFPNNARRIDEFVLEELESKYIYNSST
jgi:hypothetical protein